MPSEVTRVASQERITRFIDAIAEIDRDPAGGWTRLAFSAGERRAHAVFAAAAHEIGLEVRTDAAGNTLADTDGTRRALVVGSHLDTVYNGGAFDGVAGVALALEVATLLADTPLRAFGYRAVAFAAEEGARFGTPCIGSRLVLGELDVAALATYADRDGIDAARAARDAGVAIDDVASARWRASEIVAFLEVHIEQGRVLQERGLHLGVVDAVAGSTRVELRFEGLPDHSGATPMHLRHDALAGASEFVGAVEEQARTHRSAVATVGRFTVEPNSITTVPGAVECTLDVRDVDPDRQRELTEQLLDRAQRIVRRRGLTLRAELLSDQSSAVLHRSLRGALLDAAVAADVPFCVLRSGAGHDAQHLSHLCPSGMLFVPCRDGVSHNPDEWCDTEDLARAAHVVAAALRAIDAEDGSA